MEILLLQYALVVLVCIWGLKPFKSIAFGKHMRVSSFNLMGVLSISFIVIYTLVHELKSKTGDTTTVFFSWINMLLFAIIPAIYLYLRRQVISGSFRKADMIHLLPFLVYGLFFMIPHALYKGTDKFYFISTIVYGYGVVGVYIFMLMKYLLITYNFTHDGSAGSFAHSSSSTAKIENRGAYQEKQPAPVPEKQRFNGVLVGSVHLDEAHLQKMDATLKDFFRTHQPFLKRGYNLKQLSEDISIPLHHLSAFINQYYHIHFNDFINEYRVLYCQQKIKNDEWKFKTLEAIAEESGFNNRNTFTAAFKKITGNNPSVFLKSVKLKEVA